MGQCMQQRHKNSWYFIKVGAVASRSQPAHCD
jgi:hypothetical protein